MKEELWLQFKNAEDFMNKENLIYEALEDNYGGSSIVIYLRDTKIIKRLPATKNIYIDDDVIGALEDICGKGNVAVTEKYDQNMKTVNQEEQMERIADYLEEISLSLKNIDEHLEKFEDCIGYVPPNQYQKDGYFIFRIGGSVDTGTY